MKALVAILLSFHGCFALACDVACPVPQSTVLSTAAIQESASSGKVPLKKRGGLLSGVVLAIGGLLVRSAFGESSANEGDHGATEGDKGVRGRTNKKGSGGAYQFCGEGANPELGEEGKLLPHRVYRMYVAAEDGKFVASKKKRKATCESVLIDGNGEIMGRVSLGAVFRDANNVMTAVPTKVKGSQLGLTGDHAHYNYDAWPPIGNEKDNAINWVLGENGGCPCLQNAVYSFVQSDPDEPSQLAARKYTTDDDDQPSPVGIFADLNQLVKDSQEAAKDQEDKAEGEQDFQFARLFEGQEDPQFYKSVEEFSRVHKVNIWEVLRGVAKLSIPEGLKNLFAAVTGKKEQDVADDPDGEGASRRPTADVAELDDEDASDRPVKKPPKKQAPKKAAKKTVKKKPQPKEEDPPAHKPAVRVAKEDEPDRVVKPEVERLIETGTREQSEDLIALDGSVSPEELEEKSDDEIRALALETVGVSDNLLLRELCDYNPKKGLGRIKPLSLLDGLKVDLANPNSCRVSEK